MISIDFNATGDLLQNKLRRRALRDGCRPATV